MVTDSDFVEYARRKLRWRNKLGRGFLLLKLAFVVLYAILSVWFVLRIQVLAQEGAFPWNRDFAIGLAFGTMAGFIAGSAIESILLLFPRADPYRCFSLMLRYHDELAALKVGSASPAPNPP